MAEYLKIPEVARRLDVSEKTARRYVKSGALPSRFIGGAYRVSEEDVEEFLEQAKVESGKAEALPSLEPSFNDVLAEEQRLPAPESMEDLLEQVGATTRHLARTREDLRTACEGTPQDEVRQFYREVLTEKRQIGPVLDQRYNTPPGEELRRLNLLWREQFYKGWDAAGSVDRRLKEIATTESEEQAKVLEEEAAKLASELVSNAA